MTETITETVTPPTERVPIMLEIKEEDRQKASHYEDNRGCLIHTALSRMGYKPYSVSSTYVRLTDQNDIYKSDEILPGDLRYTSGTNAPYYNEKVVGKQIILYPA